MSRRVPDDAAEAEHKIVALLPVIGVERTVVEQVLTVVFDDGGVRGVVGTAMTPIMRTKDELHALKQLTQGLAAWMDRNANRFAPSDAPDAPGRSLIEQFPRFEHHANELLTRADIEALNSWATAYYGFPLGARTVDELYAELRRRAAANKKVFHPTDMAMLLLVLRPPDRYWSLHYQPKPKESFSEAVTRIAHAIASARTKAEARAREDEPLHVPPRKRRDCHRRACIGGCLGSACSIS